VDLPTGGYVTTTRWGAFIVDLPEGHQRLMVSARGYAPAIEDVRVPGSISIALVPEAVIEGRMLQGTGTGGVAGAELILKGSDLRSGATGADGSFRFDMLRPGSYTLTARGAGWAVPAEKEIALDPGETKQVVLHAEPARSVSADIIVEETGEPCPKSYVVVGNLFTHAEERGGSDGRVTVHGLLPGRYSVRAHCLDWGTVTVPLVIVDRSLEGLRWSIPVGHRIRGTVLRPDATPVGGAMVFVHRLGRRGLPIGTSTITDARGRFELRGVGPGSHRVNAKVGEALTSSVVRVGRTSTASSSGRPAPATEPRPRSRAPSSRSTTRRSPARGCSSSRSRSTALRRHLVRSSPTGIVASRRPCPARG
jgi:hypothetical protein